MPFDDCDCDDFDGPLLVECRQGRRGRRGDDGVAPRVLATAIYLNAPIGAIELAEDTNYIELDTVSSTLPNFWSYDEEKGVLSGLEDGLYAVNVVADVNGEGMGALAVTVQPYVNNVGLPYAVLTQPADEQVAARDAFLSGAYFANLTAGGRNNTIALHASRAFTVTAGGQIVLSVARLGDAYEPLVV